MQDYRIVKYSSFYYNEWNEFVKYAKNATFLFHRDFIEYHSDKFEDYSLLIFRKDKLVALLPANREGNHVYSHQGLTYGGLILARDVKFEIVLYIFKGLLIYLNNKTIKTLVLKQIPLIYKVLPSEEVIYLLFLLKSNLIRRDTLSVIDLSERLEISNNRMEGFKRGIKCALTVKEEDSFELFWNVILIENLKNKHNIQPVHSLEEIMLLKMRFPNNIRQFNVYNGDKIVAGTTIFESKYVAHSQYISGDENKNSLGSLDYLHEHLINNVFKNKKYFDFGTSNENNGLNVNKGLQYWKEGFGARTITQDFYKIETGNYKLLESVMI